jgi:nucleoside-diphosphate-sugar epimerase
MLGPEQLRTRKGSTMIQGTVLITGITGTIGGRLGRYLVERGCEVHGLARFSKPEPRQEDLRSAGITPWKRDLTRDALDDLPEFDYVVHEACQWDPPKGESDDPREVAAWNAGMALRALHRWRRAKAVVLASTGGVYGESDELSNEDTPPAPDAKGYHLGKFALEQIGRCCSTELDLPVIILRYFWPSDFDAVARRYVRAAQAGDTVPGTSKDNPYVWTPLDLVDVCRYTARSVEAASVPATVLVCGGPEVVSRRQLLQAAADGLGVEPVFDERPARWQRFLGDSSRLYDLFGKPERQLPDVVRAAARAAAIDRGGERC